MSKSNDAEHLVKIINGIRYYNGKVLTPSIMLWQCTVEGCKTPPKPQRRAQYILKTLCNTCKNREVLSRPGFKEKRGKAISRAIEQLGNKWSETAKKNMSSEETKDKISKGMIDYISNNKEEALKIRSETAIANNKNSGFGTSQFAKDRWAKK